MSFWETVKYEIWPALKVRLIYWWWIIKYGGKKNIPPELIFGRINKSMARISENLMDALKTMPPDATEDEKKELINLIRETGELEKEVGEMKP